MLTYDYLRKILEYDPDTGVWRWLITGKNIACGQVAGTIGAYGYRIITIHGQKCRSARLAVLYMTGEWPSEEVDHINRRVDDDRWENLRVVCRSENALNRGMQSNNTSSARGVHWDTARGKWFVQVKKDGVNTFIGRFDSFDEAVEARDAFAEQAHGDFAQLNKESKP